MDCIGKKKPLDKNFDPSTYRKDVAYNLLLKSENMEEICLNCFSSIFSKYVKCKLCNRKCHAQCLYKSEVGTDVEDEKIAEITTKKVKHTGELPQKFICKLCKRYKDGVYVNM